MSIFEINETKHFCLQRKILVNNELIQPDPHTSVILVLFIYYYSLLMFILV